MRHSSLAASVCHCRCSVCVPSTVLQSEHRNQHPQLSFANASTNFSFLSVIPSSPVSASHCLRWSTRRRAYLSHCFLALTAFPSLLAHYFHTLLPQNHHKHHQQTLSRLAAHPPAPLPLSSAVSSLGLHLRPDYSLIKSDLDEKNSARQTGLVVQDYSQSSPQPTSHRAILQHHHCHHRHYHHDHFLGLSSIFSSAIAAISWRWSMLISCQRQQTFSSLTLLPSFSIALGPVSVNSTRRQLCPQLPPVKSELPPDVHNYTHFHSPTTRTLARSVSPFSLYLLLLWRNMQTRASALRVH